MGQAGRRGALPPESDPLERAAGRPALPSKRYVSPVPCLGKQGARKQQSARPLNCDMGRRRRRQRSQQAPMQRRLSCCAVFLVTRFASFWLHISLGAAFAGGDGVGEQEEKRDESRAARRQVGRHGKAERWRPQGCNEIGQAGGAVNQRGRALKRDGSRGHGATVLRAYLCPKACRRALRAEQ